MTKPTYIFYAFGLQPQTFIIYIARLNIMQ